MRTRRMRWLVRFEEWVWVLKLSRDGFAYWRRWAQEIWGEVYRAKDIQTLPDDSDRHVAVKTILRRRSGAPLTSDADVMAVERFAREVRIMRKLAHPNIPRTISGGVDDTNGTEDTFEAQKTSWRASPPSSSVRRFARSMSSARPSSAPLTRHPKRFPPSGWQTLQPRAPRLTSSATRSHAGSKAASV